MIVLDTNVISALMKPSANQIVFDWLETQPRASIWTTAITVFEIKYGLQILAEGRKRSALVAAFDHLVSETMDNRIAPFDAAASERAGELMAIRHKKGRPGELRDTMIAGIVLVRRATLVTRNTSHFEDLDVRMLNPWED
jgi:toxin FitB